MSERGCDGCDGRWRGEQNFGGVAVHDSGLLFVGCLLGAVLSHSVSHSKIPSGPGVDNTYLRLVLFTMFSTFCISTSNIIFVCIGSC